MILITLLFILLASILTVAISLKVFPQSLLSQKIRLIITGSVLSVLRSFLHTAKLIRDEDMPKKQKSRGKLKSRIILTSLLFLIFSGITAMVYPLFSSLYMEKVQSQILSQYHTEITDSNKDTLNTLLKNAQEYNQGLSSGRLSLLTPEENGYFEQLLIPGGSQIMAYVHIPKIHVRLPVFHGVGTDTLEAGCGHMPQSSLPIGGDSTHAVLSAHTGMASAAMFSDLPLLVPGDTFSIDILGETLTYQIQSQEDIRTVLPVEVQSVKIQSGLDLCTLVTCVPFGVNSHRLLVTGHRIETPEESAEVLSESTNSTEPVPSLWKTEYLKSLIIGLILLGGILLTGVIFYLFLRYRKKGNYEK